MTNRDFPTLDRFGESLFTAARRREMTERRRRRVARRALALTGVLLVGVPAAVATRNVFTDPVAGVEPARPVDPTAPVILARGESSGIDWTLSAYESDRGRCMGIKAFRSTAQIANSCVEGVPDRRALGVRTVVRSDASFVFGDTSTSVTRVVLRSGQRVELTALTQVPAPEVIRRSGLRPNFRTFVFVLPGALDPGNLSVTAQDASGKVLDRFGAPTGPKSP